MPAMIGPSHYIYVCTRLRARKAKLIPRDEYIRMLNMGLPEITRLIQETTYKREIDELSTSFSGIDLIEVSLSWNLAKEYQTILKILPRPLQHLTSSYLRRWDIQNVLTILRGKDQGLPAGRIKEVLVPAGELDRALQDRLLMEDTSAKIVEMLKGWRLYPVLSREFAEAEESGRFARLENELYKKFYADVVADARAVRGGRAFIDYVQLEIDIRNLQSLFRLRAAGEKGDLREFMIPGGSVSVEELQRLSAIEDLDEFIDAMKTQVTERPLLALLDDLKQQGSLKGRSLQETEIVLTRIKLAQMERMSKAHPFSIWPILAYLELKKYEVFKLRTITRGKEANLSPECIRSYLVM